MNGRLAQWARKFAASGALAAVQGDVMIDCGPDWRHAALQEVLPPVARCLMGTKVTVDFPDAWRTNLVEVREERRERREVVHTPRRHPLWSS